MTYLLIMSNGVNISTQWKHGSMVNYKIRSFTGLNFNQWAWLGLHIGEISVKVSCRITMAEGT